ncbi:hypothetical protein, partial [Klebsiella pneumoniae]|uniref:hypothetical protein n=1 Tax=Klebsiella pneumoniae TaxID=573 RepID=UPI0021F78CD0
MRVVVLADADGDGVPESYEAAAPLDADPLLAEATAALQADLDGQLPESFTVTEDGTKVVITGPAGLVFEVRARAFDADGAPGVTTLTLAQP